MHLSLHGSLLPCFFLIGLQMRGEKNSAIFKEKKIWQQEEKEMSNTSVSAFQKGLFESSVVPKVLTHPWHFSASTFTLKQNKLLYGGVKQGCTGEQWGVHTVCIWEYSLRSYIENLLILQVKRKQRKRENSLSAWQSEFKIWKPKWVYSFLYVIAGTKVPEREIVLGGNGLLGSASWSVLLIKVSQFKDQ